MDIECTVCNDLIETAPDLATYGGITDTMCNSLKNDTGLNPSLSVLHTDCEDYDTMNDCLIGRPDSDLEKYESCEWRKFMHNWIPNVHTMFKAMTCAICGLWTNVHNLWTNVNSLTNRLDDLEDRVTDLCGLLNQQINQNMDTYGTLTGTGWGDVSERQGGEIVEIDGASALTHPRTDLWDGVGFWYKKSQYRNCDGEVKTYEWFQPYFREYAFNTQLDFSEAFWKCSVEQLRTWGWTESLIAWLTDFPQWWQGYCVSWGVYFTTTIYAQIVNGYLELRVIGASDTTFSGHVITGHTKAPVLWIS